LLYGYQWAQPGKKLLFMGSEWGQGHEWDHDHSLDWHLLDHGWHQGVLRWVSDLNKLYRAEPALHEQDCRGAGFEWVDCNDAASSIITFMRKATNGEQILVVCSFTPVTRFGYRVGVPYPGRWEELINSDAMIYGGSGQGNKGGFEAEEMPWHGRNYSLSLTVPPLAVFAHGLQSTWKPFAEIRGALDRTVGELFSRFSAVQLLIVSTLAGISEEALFRAVAQGGLEGVLGRTGALFAAAVAFGCAHLLNWSYGFMSVLAGLYLGGLWLATGNLLTPIITHGLYDFLALVYYFKISRRDANRGVQRRRLDRRLLGPRPQPPSSTRGSQVVSHGKTITRPSIASPKTT
jgi:membrane protease YdiL (CAAX protease family)